MANIPVPAAGTWYSASPRGRIRSARSALGKTIPCKLLIPGSRVARTGQASPRRSAITSRPGQWSDVGRERPCPRRSRCSRPEGGATFATPLASTRLRQGTSRRLISNREQVSPITIGGGATEVAASRAAGSRQNSRRLISALAQSCDGPASVRALGGSTGLRQDREIALPVRQRLHEDRDRSAREILPWPRGRRACCRRRMGG